MSLLIIDESGEVLGGSARYVIGAGVLIAADLEQAREMTRALLTLTANRPRPFHGRYEGPVLRRAALEVIGALGIHAQAVVVAAQARDQEHARERCLRELIRATSTNELTSIMIESRERSITITGQNRRDYGTLIEARHAGELRRTAHYQWVSKNEPLVWLADAVAGAILAAERGDPTWRQLLSALTPTNVVRLAN